MALLGYETQDVALSFGDHKNWDDKGTMKLDGLACIIAAEDPGTYIP